MTKPTLLTDAELDAKLAASPAERVTKEYIESRITETTFHRTTETLTTCVITLDNGFFVTGESACVNPENYNQQIGETNAFKQAYSKLWPLFGFLLAEKNKLAKTA